MVNIDFSQKHYLPEISRKLRRADGNSNNSIDNETELFQAAKSICNAADKTSIDQETDPTNKAILAEQLLVAQLQVVEKPPRQPPQPLMFSPPTSTLSVWQNNLKLWTGNPQVYAQTEQQMVDKYDDIMRAYSVDLINLDAKYFLNGHDSAFESAILRVFDIEANHLILKKGQHITSLESKIDAASYKELISHWQKYIQDPDKKHIVSEGQGVLLKIAATMATIDPLRAHLYQADFDALLRGTERMIKLSQVPVDPDSSFPAWRVELNGHNDIELPKASSPSGGNPNANSASDADLDIVAALRLAFNNIQSVAWTSHDTDYQARLDPLLTAAKEKLFETITFTDDRGLQHSFILMKPSEDEGALRFTDYLRPGDCLRFAEYYRGKHDTENEKFWTKAAHDSAQVYEILLSKHGEFPAQYAVTEDPQIRLKIDKIYGSTQTWDGIRSPKHLAEYITELMRQQLPTPLNIKQIAEFAMEKGEARASKMYVYTGSTTPQYEFTVKALDYSMYLTLATAAGDQVRTGKIQPQIPALFSQRQNYYTDVFAFSALLTAFYPEGGS